MLDRTPGGQSFTAKVLAVQNAGGVGCIIADSGPPPADGLGLRAAIASPATTTLTVLLISKVDGATLQTSLQAGPVTVTLGATFVAPPPPVVDPFPTKTGNEVEFLASDGTKRFWTKLVVLDGGISAATAKLGTGLSLVATSWGSVPPPTYQWTKDGVVVVGATDQIFSIAAVAATDAGSYACTASNSAGSATSVAVAVTITP